MSAEFRSTIKLDAEKATAQAVAFSNAIKKGSVNVNKFNELVKKTTQGGAENVFRKYENSVGKLDVKFRKSVASLHSMKNGMTDTGRELDKLTSKTDKLTKAEIKRGNVLLRNLETERKALPILVALNQKYDENARVVARAKQIRNELNLVVASGLKTKKEALAIFKREIESLKQSTALYKDKAAAVSKAKRAQEAEKKNLESLRVKYDSVYAAKKKLSKVESELTLLQKKGLITGKQRESILKKEKIAIDRATHAQENYNTTMGYFARVARKVSIASRVMLVGYLALAGVNASVEFAKTAESVDLLRQKLEYFTGDSGVYQKFFDMTQAVGIRLKDAGRIMTRFAVVTRGAFSSDAMISWVSTLTKSARATGTTTQEMTGALIQITQAMSAGRLMGDEYRSVTENLPLLTVELRKIFSGTNLSLKELSSKGLITVDKIVQAIESLKSTVAEIPGVTDTIDAKLDALSSSWDNFLNKVTDTQVIKIPIQFITDMVNGASFFHDLIKGSDMDRALDEVDRRLSDAKRDLEAKNKGQNVSVHMKEGFLVDEAEFYDISKKSATELEKAISDLNDERARVFMSGGMNEGQRNIKDLNDERLAVEKLEKFKQDVRKKEEELANAGGGARITALRAIHKLELEGLESRTKLDKANGSRLTQSEAQLLSDKKTILLQEKIDKANKTSIDSRIALSFASKTSDIESLASIENYSGSVIKIREELRKNEEKINKAILKGRLEVEKGLKVGKFGGVSEGEGKDQILRHQALAQDAVTKSIQRTQAEINSITGGSSGGKYEKYIDTINKLNKKQSDSSEKLSKIYTQASTEKVQFAKTESISQTELAESYRKQREELLENVKISLGGESADRLKATRDKRVATDNLTSAQKLLSMSNQEVAKTELGIQNAYTQTINLLDAKSGRLSQQEQFNKGSIQGLKDFQEQVKTTYEIVADVTSGVLGEAYNQTVVKQLSLVAAANATTTAFDKGFISLENYRVKMNELHVEQSNINLENGTGSFADVMIASMGTLVSDYTNIMTELKGINDSFFQSFTDGFADSVGAAIIQGDDLGESMRNVARGALQELISGMVKLGIQMLVQNALSTTSMTATTAASVAAASVTAAAWAPAAAASSLASFGSNAIPAAAGISSTYALTSLLSAVPGFETGGYTGDKKKNEMAGIVHGREFVVNADATSKNRGLLESLNAGNQAKSITSNSSGVANQKITIINSGRPIEVVSDTRISETERRIIIKEAAEVAEGMVASGIARGDSDVAMSLQSTYGIDRSYGSRR